MFSCLVFPSIEQVHHIDLPVPPAMTRFIHSQAMPKRKVLLQRPTEHTWGVPSSHISYLFLLLLRQR